MQGTVAACLSASKSLSLIHQEEPSGGRNNIQRKLLNPKRKKKANHQLPGN